MKIKSLTVLLQELVETRSGEMVTFYAPLVENIFSFQSVISRQPQSACWPLKQSIRDDQKRINRNVAIAFDFLSTQGTLFSLISALMNANGPYGKCTFDFPISSLPVSIYLRPFLIGLTSCFSLGIFIVARQCCSVYGQSVFPGDCFECFRILFGSFRSLHNRSFCW